MIHFPHKITDQAGSIARFWFAPRTTVNVPEVIGTEVMNLTPTGGWRRGAARQNSFSFRSQLKRSATSIGYDKSLSGFIPGNTPEIASYFAVMEGRRFVVLFQDGAGVLKLLGLEDRGAVFSAAFNSGGSKTESNGYQFSFSSFELYESPLFTGTITEA